MGSEVDTAITNSCSCFQPASQGVWVFCWPLEHTAVCAQLPGSRTGLACEVWLPQPTSHRVKSRALCRPHTLVPGPLLARLWSFPVSPLLQGKNFFVPAPHRT